METTDKTAATCQRGAKNKNKITTMAIVCKNCCLLTIVFFNRQTDRQTNKQKTLLGFQVQENKIAKIIRYVNATKNDNLAQAMCVQMMSVVSRSVCTLLLLIMNEITDAILPKNVYVPTYSACTAVCILISDLNAII